MRGMRWDGRYTPSLWLILVSKKERTLPASRTFLSLINSLIGFPRLKERFLRQSHTALHSTEISSRSAKPPPSWHLPAIQLPCRKLDVVAKELEQMPRGGQSCSLHVPKQNFRRVERSSKHVCLEADLSTQPVRASDPTCTFCSFRTHDP